MARADLDAAHALTLSAHPGAIDRDNPAFLAWAERGYREAQALIPRVMSYDNAMAAVRYYIAGFRDGHFIYSDNARKGYPIWVNGWRLEVLGGRYLVDAVITPWPSELPPLGAELLQCDGRQPASILSEDVRPFSHTSGSPEYEQQQLASQLWALPMGGLELKSCQFRLPDAGMRTIAVKYHPVTQDQYFDASAANQRPDPERPGNSYTVKDGVVWIRAANFNLRPGTDQARALDAMLTDLAQIKGARTIVFDARGNGGGDSGIGDRIFEAATGGLDYDERGIERLPRTYAQWRVSDVSIASTERHLARRQKVYGDQHPEQLRQSSAFLAQLKAARDKGEPWVVQENGHRVTADDVAQRQGRLRRFSGTLVLVTDANCTSACLDFADLIRQVPGALHVGQTTGSDTVYIDVGDAELPSKNRLFLPLKVWRNRLRANNEQLVPHVKLPVLITDDAAVRAATLAALGSRLPSP